jgi:hypothetical protein
VAEAAGQHTGRSPVSRTGDSNDHDCSSSGGSRRWHRAGVRDVRNSARAEPEHAAAIRLRPASGKGYRLGRGRNAEVLYKRAEISKWLERQKIHEKRIAVCARHTRSGTPPATPPHVWHVHDPSPVTPSEDRPQRSRARQDVRAQTAMEGPAPATETVAAVHGQADRGAVPPAGPQGCRGAGGSRRSRASIPPTHVSVASQNGDGGVRATSPGPRGD